MKRIFIVAMLTLFCVSANAQSALFTTIPVDARSAAMGGVGNVNPSAFAIYQVGALTAFNSETQYSAGASFIMWRPQETNAMIIAASGYGKLTSDMALMAGYRQFVYPSYEIVTSQGRPTGQMFAPKESAIDLGVVYGVMDNLSAALNLHYIHSGLGVEASASAFAADLNAAYRLNPVIVSLAVNNLGTPLDYGNGGKTLAMNVAAGASTELPLGSSVLNAGVEARYGIADGAISVNIGGEYTYNQMASLRLGAQIGQTGSYGSVGLGFSFAGFGLDASYLISLAGSNFDQTLGLSLSWKMGE